MFKKLLKKVGIDLDKKVICSKCGKEINEKDKRCPYCNAWNDCCSPDPLKMEEARKRVEARKKKK